VAWLAGLLHALVDIDYRLVVVAYPWWVISGLLLAPSADPAPAPVRRPWRPGGVGQAWFLLAGFWLAGLADGAVAVAVLAGLAAAACAWAVATTLLRTGPPLLAPRRDAPWLLLAGLGWAWIAWGTAPAVQAVAALEATGLLAIMLLARAAVRDGGGGVLERGVGWTTLALAAWAIGETAVTGHAARATFPSPNFLATVLVAGLAMRVATLHVPGPRARRWTARDGWGWAAAALLAVGIAVTGSSGAGLAAAIIGGGWCLARLPLPHPARWAGGIAVALLLGLVVVPRVDALSLVQRGGMWREATRLLAAAPFGRGPGMYAAEVLRVQEPSVTTAGVGRFSLVAEFAHCDPLQFAVEWGLPALGLLLWGLVVLGRGSRPAGSAWRWGLAAVALHSLTDFPLRAPALEVLVAVAAGATTAVGGARPRGRPEGARIGRRGRWLVVAVAAASGMAWVRPVAGRLLDGAGAGSVAAELDAAHAVLAAWPLSVGGHLREARAHIAMCEASGSWRGPSAARAEERLATAAALGNGTAGERIA
jgi:hypothetical protein